MTQATTTGRAFPSGHAVARVAPHRPGAARPCLVCGLARRRPGVAPGMAGPGRCPPQPHHARQPGALGDPAAACPPRVAGRGEPGPGGGSHAGTLRNPLAEPGVVGVSGCAAFGAVLTFYTGLSVTVPLALPLGGIAGALLAVGLLALLTGRQASTLTLILAGVALNSLAGALTTLALNLAPNPYAAVEIIFWLMGSLADRSLHHVILVLPLMLGGWGLLLHTAQALDGLTLGEDTARSLGVRLGGCTATRCRHCPGGG